MSNILTIENKKIGENYPIYFIAEAGLNHNGDIKIAKKMIEYAAECNADAIKFQTYKTEKFLTSESPYFDLFKKVELPFDKFAELKDYSKSNNITFFSTPFDTDSVDYLSSINVPCFKTSSSDLTNMPLIRHIAKTKKPMIISSGLATLQEVEEAVNWCLSESNSNLALLHCVSNYPTLPEETNLSVIENLKRKFGCTAGYSDNGDSDLVVLAAVSMGASIIEKHFTMDKKLTGPDHSFSIEPKELKFLISQIREIETMKGNGIKCPNPSELNIRIMGRKSITINKNIKKGQILTKDMFEIKRPLAGIEPKYIEQIIGLKINKDITKDTAINWKDID